ncbi:hypothetical protein [Paenibacillus sp. WLX2291]|uniref:hypothetical protein n=1 Tax=Paenibacillus sp. WLX2291 TaxID=3296934 RepID=UPI0039842EFE
MLKTKTTVRYEIEKEMKKQGYNLNSFSLASGINRGVLSAVLHGNSPKPISITQLDIVCGTLNKPIEWIYALFIKELFEEEKLHWRRIKPLIEQCVILKKVDFVKKILSKIPSTPLYIKKIFHIAESFPQVMYQSSTKLLYEFIILNQNDHSEILAISQYRLYMNSANENLKEFAENSFKFSPFRSHLPTSLALEALLRLATHAYNLEDWSLLRKYGHEMHTIALSLYKNQNNKNFSAKYLEGYELQRPLVVYYGQSNLIKFISYEYEKNYNEALKSIEAFEDLSWFNGLDKQGWIEVENFKKFAIFNRHNLQLLQGDNTGIEEYFGLLEFYQDEILPTLLIALKTSNMHNWNIDQYLSKYHYILYPDDFVNYFEVINEHYSLQSTLNRYVNIYYELAVYYFNQKKLNNELDHCLSILQKLIDKFSKSRALDCLELLKKINSIPKMET